MKVLAFLCLLSTTAVDGSYDRFNYDVTDLEDRNFGPADWGMVNCPDVETCPGWPTNWEDFNAFIPYNGTEHMCQDCSSSENPGCRRHKQSPIDLMRDVTGEKECKDRHRMNFVTGNCKFNQVDFQILPHVLRAYQPERCGALPNIDFSMGFPHPWHLSFTDISVPSQHAQEGKRYDAEVVLSHVYSKNNAEKLIGNVAIFLERGNDTDHYDFLDLYTRRWLKTERAVFQACRARNMTPSSRRRGTATGTDDDIHELSTRQTAGGLPQWLSKPFFNRSYHPYDWYVKSGTEYYFRYEGSMAEPPCFNTVHWRILKDAIRVSPKQINRLERLLARRLNPETCQRESAGKPRQGNDKLRDVARPLQTKTNWHRLIFCECGDWESRRAADQDYCRLPAEQRGVHNLTR